MLCASKSTKEGGREKGREGYVRVVRSRGGCYVPLEHEGGREKGREGGREGGRGM